MTIFTNFRPMGETARVTLTTGNEVVEWRDAAGFYWYSVNDGPDWSNVDLANDLSESEIAELLTKLEGEEV